MTPTRWVTSREVPRTGGCGIAVGTELTDRAALADATRRGGRPVPLPRHSRVVVLTAFRLPRRVAAPVAEPGEEVVLTTALAHRLAAGNRVRILSDASNPGVKGADE